MCCRLDYQPLFGKMSPHSSLFGEDQRPDPGDGGNRAKVCWELLNISGTRFAEFDFLIEAFEFAPKFVLHEFKKGIEACVHHKRKRNVPVPAKWPVRSISNLKR